MYKRIAALAALAVLAAPPAQAAELDLERLSATELAQKLQAREITSVEPTKAYIDRIAAVNKRGPAINAVRSLNPNALQEARVSDIARRTNSVRGPMEGLPGAAQGQHRRGRYADHGVLDRARALRARQGLDARAQASRRPGAVILGKVNLTEFAAYVSNSQRTAMARCTARR